MHRLLVATAEKILDDGVSQFVKPGQDSLVKFVALPYQRNAEKEFLRQAQTHLHANLLESGEFKKAGPDDQVAVVRTLQLHIKDLQKNPKRAALVGSAVAKAGQAGAVVGHLRELQRVTANLMEKQLQVTRELKEGVDAVEKVLSSKLPPEERVLWLARGLGRIPPLREASEAVTRQVKKSLKGAEGYLDAGEQLLGLAQAVGIKGNTTRIASKVLQTGRAILKGITSGNPVKVIGAVFDALFGGPDPAEERHREVMEKLGQIEAKIDLVLENQKRIHEAVLEVDRKVVELTAEVRKNHAEVMMKLERLTKDVLKNREYLHEILEKDHKTLATFLEIDTEQTHTRKAAWFAINRQRFIDADRVLGTIRVSKDFPKISLYFTSPRPDEHSTAAVELLTYFRKRAEEGFSQAVSRLVSPSFTDGHLRAKLASAARPVPGEQFPFEQFGTLLNGKAVRTYGDSVLRFTPYLFLVDESGQPPRLLTWDLKDAAQDGILAAKRKKALEYLRDPLYLVNVAIAQRALLGGDVLLPDLCRRLESQSVDKEMLDLLKKHPVLARNLVAHLVAERARASGGSSLAYAFAFAAEDPESMVAFTRVGARQLTTPSILGASAAGLAASPLGQGPVLAASTLYPRGTSFTFRRESAVYAEDGKPVERSAGHLLVNDLAIPVPSPEEFENGTLLPADELPELYHLRERLITEMASYTFTDGLSGSERRALSLLALQNK